MRSKLTLCLAPLVALAIGSCNDTTTTKYSAHPVGSILRNPAANSLAPVFVAANAIGRAPQLGVSSVAFGRLVDVYGREVVDVNDPDSHIDTLVATEVLIRAGLQSGPDYDLETDRVTGQENLFIKRTVTDALGLASFDLLLKDATEGLDQVFDNGFGIHFQAVILGELPNLGTCGAHIQRCAAGDFGA